MIDNKHNTTGDSNDISQKKKAVGKESNSFNKTIKFLRDLLDFRNETDRESTIEAIKNDISFRGASAWILVCSIFVASIGLNVNSTAVVIGAMLISPLMGPILGAGLSIAINDIYTLKKSLINLTIMVVLSLLTAFLFFKFFPLSEETSELFARTKPDIRDVLIAFFGGLALIIARTKKGTIASVIFGVAIATALMPPLCTAGYGLAKGNYKFFLGAMYLFTINAIFIALATFVVIKVLRFPMLRYANSTRRKRTAQLASVLAITVMIPAVLTFINVLEESKFNSDAKAFINSELTGLPNFNYIQKNASYTYNKNGESIIELILFGTDEISQSTRDLLEQKFFNYGALNSTKLHVKQVKNKIINSLEYMTELRIRDSIDLMSQQQKIKYLEDKVIKLSRLERDQIPFEQITQEVKVNYENIEQFGYYNILSTNFKDIDTLSVFTVKWIDSLTKENTRKKDKIKLEKWLKIKLQLDTLVVKRIN